MPFSPEVLMQIQPLISQVSPSLLTQGQKERETIYSEL